MKTSTKDFYAVLGVSRDAATADIKRAYRRLAKRYHPDLNPSPDAAERFRELTEAYDTLIDPGKRRHYDRLGGTRPGPGAGTGSSRSGGTGSSTGSAAGGNHSEGVTQAASRILRVLEDTWMEIRRRHPEIPPVVIIIASGTEGKQARYGHHAPGRWHVAGQQLGEIMISGEGLRRTPREVLGTLLHEAAHALAAARGVRDTSRQGRYHNEKFAALARELGLDVTKDTRFGWTLTAVTDPAADRYARQLAALRIAMTLWRASETTPGPATRPRSSNLIAATCSCERIIRVAPSTLAAAPILCGDCDGKFEPRDS